MSKRVVILSVLISLVMVLTVAGIVSAKTYDFTNIPLLHEAYKGCDWTDNPPSSLEVGTQITDTIELAKFKESDDERACYSCYYNEVLNYHNNYGSQGWDYHRFVFKIENSSGITRFLVLHEGYGTGGHTLYIWNYTTLEWEEVDTTALDTPDQTLSKTFTSDFSDYIQGGYLHLLAMSNVYQADTICTDYVKVETTTPSPIGVGGEAYSVNKLAILAPWIGLAMLLIGGITWFTLTRRRAQS